MIVEFPPFRPDLQALNNPGLTILKNLIPRDNYYAPVKALTAYSDALNSACKGGFASRLATTGQSVNFAGTATKLYRLGTTTLSIFEDVSKAGGYSLGADDIWSFTQYSDQVIAVAITDNPQYYEIGTSTDFADLSGSPPKARYCGVVGDFLVFANTYDGVDGNVPNRVRWPGIGTTTSWTVSATTQADYQDLDASHGWIMGFVGGEYGMIFQERGITRMEYVGSPLVFQFNNVEGNRGTRFPGSIIRIGGLVYFISHDGFCVTDGQNSYQIGDEMVDTFFYNDIDLNYESRVCVAVDYARDTIMWAYPSSSRDLGGNPSRILYYDYSKDAQKRWGYSEIDLEYLAQAYSEGYTLDSLDDWLSAQGLSKHIELLPYSLDSRFWTGNNVDVGAYNTDHRLGFFSGSALTAMIETAEMQLNPGQRTNLLRVKPLIEGSSPTITVQVGVRNLQHNSAVSYASAVSLDSNGDAQVRSNAFFQRLRFNISGNYSKAIGFEILEQYPGGNR